MADVKTNRKPANRVFKSLHNYDVGTGVSLNSSLDLNSKLNYYLGASAYHVNSPTEREKATDELMEIVRSYLR